LYIENCAWTGVYVDAECSAQGYFYKTYKEAERWLRENAAVLGFEIVSHTEPMSFFTKLMGRLPEKYQIVDDRE
jgi:hypothetical protein